MPRVSRALPLLLLLALALRRGGADDAADTMAK
jgi:hypothetical protein